MKDGRVNLRLNLEDIKKIREIAKSERIPYQTLMGSVLHKYATNQFFDQKTIKNFTNQMNSKKIEN